LAAGLFVGGAAHGGAWPMEEGRGQAISTLTIDAADSAFGADGEASLEADFQKLESSTFIEWGLTPRLTLVAQPVVQSLATRSPDGAAEEATGFASSQIGARWLLARGAGGVLSVQGALIAPGTGENLVFARFGDGGPAAEARLLAGHGWGGERRGVFVDGQAGYRWRADEEPEEARFDVTLGVRASPELMILTQSFSAWTEEAPALLLPETESHKAQISVVRRINERYAVQVGGFGAYAGRNVVEERAVFTALWLRFPS
jgi:hypothetical protein